jgi:putative chitinase
MSNLLGQPFKDWVREQIDVRQKSLGKYANIPSKDLQYYTTKTPWIRLASSVNLNKTKIESASVFQKLITNGLTEDQIIGNNLAKNLILQGGALSSTIGKNDEIVSNGLNSGLNNGNSLFNGAYGWGGIEERGYVPMPGITNADVQYLNNGALTKTTINIKCFSKRQFQLIDVLYLRPGYSLLLEFGHSVYLDNSGELQSFDTFSTSPLRTLLNPGGKSQYDIYREIEQARFDYNGNYDAVYGKISNFNWQFNPDGSYDCQVVLTGMGDVIESLKMNTTIDTGNIQVDDRDTIEETNSESNPIIANKTKTQLNEILYKLYQQIKDVDKITSYKVSIPNFPNPKKDFKEEKLEIRHALLSFPIIKSDKKEENQSPQTYMTFGTLIAFLQNQFLLYNKTGDNKRTPITLFDMDFDNLANDENYILSFPGEFSADPTICLIPYTNTAKPIRNLRIPPSPINNKLIEISSWEVDSSLYLGRLAAIYVNMNYISNALLSLTPDEENKISLLDFLKEIIKGIIQSLGGFNKISIKSTIDGKIQFIEDIPQNLNTNKTDEELARFKVFGVKPGVEGSFIKNINLTADLSPDYGTMISIGAQNNGNQLSGNATSFSNYNAGLEDRIIPEKSSYTPKTSEEDDEKDEVTIGSNFKKILGKGENRLFSSVYIDKNFISENIITLKSLNTTHADLIIGKLSKPSEDQQIQSPFFLPFNFSLEMEGLSGMILYQKFKISEEVLPPSYEEDGVEIQIKGINHSINTAAWTTKLDTLSVPAFKTKSTIQNSPYPLNSADAAVVASSPSIHKGTPGKTPPPELVKAMKDYGITNKLERAHFLSQVAHESGNYFYKQEIASGEAYEGRKDLGNTVAGDGVKFKGRGYIQLTGRFNYQAYQDSLTQRGIKDDVISNPTLVATKYAADSAAYWWKNIGRGGSGAMTRLALAGSTSDDVINVTKGVNGGTNGIDDRQTKFDYYWEELIKNPNAFT